MKFSMALILGALFFFSCSNHSNSSHFSRIKQELRINVNREPSTLDPRKGGDVVSSSLHFLLFEGLTSLNEDGSITGAQAESIEISEDRKTYTFHLRNTFWSNGIPVTAFDFEQAWKKILSPHFPAINAHLFYPIKNAEAVKRGQLPLEEVGIHVKDEKTLVVELTNPTPYFLQLTAFCVFFPVSSAIDDKFPDWAFSAGNLFVSNGPFTLKEWKHHDQIVLKKNPQYREENAISLQSIKISMVENEATALHMYENGDLDIVGSPLSPLPTDALPRMLKEGLLNIRPSAGTTICVFNTQQAPFNNINIRKALAYAIQREPIVQNITQMQEQIATNMIPPILKGNRVVNFFKDSDLEQARELFQKGLEELGMESSDFNDIPYVYNATELNHKVAQAIQQQWFNAFGFKISLENMEYKVLLDRLSKRNFYCGQALWLAQYNDPMNILERYKFKENPKNYAGWENAQYIKLLDKSALDKTSDERLHTLEEAESLFLNEMAIAPIYHFSEAFMVKPYIKNLSLSPIGTIYFTKLSIDTQGKRKR